MAKSVGKASISFGLVSVPVKLYTATKAQTVNFNMLHATDQSRIQQKLYCPVDDKIIDRSEVVKGYEFEKGRYITLTDGDLESLQSQSAHTIEITEFVPLDQVDPIYFENSYYLGSDNSDKAYRLLADAIKQTKQVALGSFTMRGKENLVLIRAYSNGLILHTVYYADEIKPLEDINVATNQPCNEAELTLAKQLIKQQAKAKFDPSQYHDQYRERVLALIEKKAAGAEVAPVQPVIHKGQVVSILDALKASLQEPLAKKPSKKKGKDPVLVELADY